MSLLPSQFSPFELSYLGDAWYEIWCRQTALAHASVPVMAHTQSTRLACCQAQAVFVQQILPSLTESEQNIFRRGKNRHFKSRPKHASVKEYRDATGFECLVGYWYLNNQQQRFHSFMESETIQKMISQIINQ